MKNFLLVLAFMCCSTAYAQASGDGGIGRYDAAIAKSKKTMAVVSLVEQQILKGFNKTPLQTRIVKVRVKRGKKKTKVYLTWHPKKKNDIATDTFIIIKVVTKVIPEFTSISLKAVHPEYMRWSGHIFWGATIIRKAIHVNNFVDPQPQPLFQ